MRPSDALSGHALLEIQAESEHSLANARPVLEVDRDQNEQQPIRSFVFNARFMRSNSPKWKPAFKDHKHDNRCDRCDIAGLIVLEIRQAAQNTTCNYEEKEEMLFDVGQAEQKIFLWNNTLFAVETKTSRASKYWASYTPILCCLWRTVPRSSYPANSGKAKATGSQTRYTLAHHNGYLEGPRVPNDDICKLVSIVRQRQRRSSRYNGRRTHPFEGSHACTAQSLQQALCLDHHWDLSSYFHNSNTTTHFRRTSTTFRSVEKAGVRCNELQ